MILIYFGCIYIWLYIWPLIYQFCWLYIYMLHWRFFCRPSNVYPFYHFTIVDKPHWQVQSFSWFTVASSPVSQSLVLIIPNKVGQWITHMSDTSKHFYLCTHICIINHTYYIVLWLLKIPCWLTMWNSGVKSFTSYFLSENASAHHQREDHPTNRNCCVFAGLVYPLKKYKNQIDHDSARISTGYTIYNIYILI